MREQFFCEIVLVLFTILAIIVPCISLWIGLRVIGRKRGLVRCGIACLSALIISTILTGIVSFFPLLNLLTPLVFFLSYLYVLKVVLGVNIVEAFAATAVSLLILLILAIITAILTGIWISFFEVRKVVHMIRF